MFFRKKVSPYKADSTVLKDFLKSRGLQADAAACQAPFKSMLFIPTGEMMVCHYNRGYKLGAYPEQSIEEVWFGEKLKKLRRSISGGDFSQGCGRCFENMSAGRFATPGPVSYDGIPDNGSTYPALMEFQLSNQCNLECVMCSGEYSSGIRVHREMLPPCPVPYDEAFVAQLTPFIKHLRKAYFTGGEPFVIPIYRKIWHLISELNPAIEMNISTNASFLDEEMKSVLQKGRFNFTVSIDSLDAANYARIRKNAGLAQTLDNIAWLEAYSKERGVVFTVKFVLLRSNIMDIPQLYNYFNARHIQLIPKIVDLPFRHSLFSSSVKELERALEVLENINPDTDTEIQLQNLKRLRECVGRLQGYLPQIKRREEDAVLIHADLPTLRHMLMKNLFLQIDADTTLEPTEKSRITASLPEIFAGFDGVSTDLSLLRAAYFAFVVQSPGLILDEIKRGRTDKLVARFRGETEQ